MQETSHEPHRSETRCTADSTANRLLDPAPMSLETDYERLPDGVLHLACRTDLHGCNGEMPGMG